LAIATKSFLRERHITGASATWIVGWPKTGDLLPGLGRRPA
jgi:hypothetical protein